MNPGEIVFRNYDQVQLEQQFRLDQVDNLQEWFTLREEISCQARLDYHCQTDICYAEGKHRTLDVFSNPEKPNNGAVQIFIHGGFWHSLDAKVFSFISNGFCPMGRLRWSSIIRSSRMRIFRRSSNPVKRRSSGFIRMPIPWR